MHAWGALAPPKFFIIIIFFYNIGIFYKYLKVIWKKKGFDPTKESIDKII